MSLTNIEGRTAFVTGASSGIGQGIAECLLENGMRVICAARRLEKLTELFSRYGDQALPIQLDVTDRIAVKNLPGRLPEAWRALDVLVANAGSDVGGRRRFDQGTAEDWMSTIDTNLTGLIALCHTLLPDMLARGRGHVVSIGSVASTFTYPGGAAYSASKYGARAFMESLRQDYKKDPVRFTEILPGLVKSGFAAARYSGDKTQAETFYNNMPGYILPSDIAQGVLYALRQPANVNIAQLMITPTADK
jgi:3-hydroxy acid dehydrogenase/malonic semialdehyde reductase